MHLIIGAFSNTIFIAKFGLIVDAYYSCSESQAASILAAVFTSLWIMVEPDMSYRGEPSRVELVTSQAAWTAATRDRALVFYCDPSLHACAEYASIHAQLSATSGTKFYQVDVSRTPEISSGAKVFHRSQPVLVLYVDGHEVDRIPRDTVKPLKDIRLDTNASLDRIFWRRAVRARFAL